MKKIILTMMLGLVASVISSSAMAELGTADEAVAMTKSAVAYAKEHGIDGLIAQVNNQDDKMFRQDSKGLYVFVYDMNGTCLALGPKPVLVGKSLIEMKDVKGTPIIKGLIEVVNTKGKGWFDYYFPNPATGLTAEKSSYVEKLDENTWLGVGIYKQ